MKNKPPKTVDIQRHLQAENYSIKIVRMCFSELADTFSGKKFTEQIHKSLGLSEYIYNFVLSSYFSLEDTQLAKENFFRFWLQGPTKYENLGEIYLRFYGALSMFWLQHDALITIYSKLGNRPEEMINAFKKTKIIRLRNIAGAHTTNLEIKGTKIKKAFIISRYSLQGDEIGILDESNSHTTFNLNACVMEFEEIFSKYLLDLALLITKKIKNKSSDNFDKFFEYAENTKLMMEEHIYFDLEHPEIVVKFKTV